MGPRWNKYDQENAVLAEPTYPIDGRLDAASIKLQWNMISTYDKHWITSLLEYDLVTLSFFLARTSSIRFGRQSCHSSLSRWIDIARKKHHCLDRHVSHAAQPFYSNLQCGTINAGARVFYLITAYCTVPAPLLWRFVVEMEQECGHMRNKFRRLIAVIFGF